MGDDTNAPDEAATEGGAQPSDAAHSAKKSIWDELNEWGKSLPDWQRFAVSHAVRDGALNDARLKEVYRLFLRANSLDSGDEELPEIPGSVTGRDGAASISQLVLKELRNLKNVNAIPETSSLTFGPGLTAIYGHNGAGKSGFARMVSSACFSRSNPEIIGNIYNEGAPEAPASAEFVIDKGLGAEDVVSFTVGDEDGDLQRISVFDSSVARIHIAEENTLGFQPAGFDVFDELTKVIGEIAEKLEADIASRDKPNTFDQLFTDPGPVADKLAGLNHQSDIDELRGLAIFGEVEQARLDEVRRQETELGAKSSVETLNALAAAKADITKLQAKISELATALGEAACSRARTVIHENEAAIRAMIAAGADTVVHPDLSMTGKREWDEFVDASRNLGQAESETYPKEGDPCLLCHRPLDEPSASLIKRMWSYLDADARKEAIAKDAALNAFIEELSEMELELLPPESRVRSDLSKLKPELVTALDGVSHTLAGRRKLLVTALESSAIEKIPEDEFEISGVDLPGVHRAIEDEESALRQGKFQEQIDKLKAEHIALRQRQVLSKNIARVVDFVENRKWIEKAKRAKPNTRVVTAKQKALFQTLIEGAYRERLREECAKMECALPIEFSARGSAGKTVRGLKVRGGYKPEKIFSEGEQRALALADFLTEVNLNPASAAIVLDDPVTSMDHTRKKRIARRLVAEAAVRQVIVFTHDIVFLTMLTEIVEGQGSLSVNVHWVERDASDTPGAVKLDEAPMNHKSYLTLHKANECLAKARKAVGQERVELIEKGADALRRTIEETIIHELLRGTVQRWDEQIRVSNLRLIWWSDGVADELRALHGETSRLIGGHSHSDEFTGGTLDPEDLAGLIDRANAAKEAIKQGKKAKKA